MKRLFFFVAAAIVIHPVSAQIIIDNTGYNTTQLVTDLLVPSSSGGVAISNVVFKGVYNHTQSGVARYQVGAFTTGASPTTLGFNTGVILTSGHTGSIPIPFGTDPRSGQIATGYTSSTPGEIRDAAGDADAKVLVGATRNINSAILEFDFVPTFANVSFNYVFGSEEYEDDSGLINYQCSDFNDKFGFLISGPGISATSGFSNNAENIAKLGNGSQVAINAVNNGVVGSSGGSPNAAKCLAANPAWVVNTPTSEYRGTVLGIAFNGTTNVLVASKTGLTPGATYHFRLIVTDAADGTYDSAVFLEAGSFSSDENPLPVEITQFAVSPSSTGNHLTWETSSEQGLSYFAVERAIDGRVFEEIGSVPAIGNTVNLQTYSYMDFSPQQFKFYRLRAVDADGAIKYSSIIEVEHTHQNNIVVFPNPAEKELHIQGLETPHLATFTMTNVLGQIVKSMTLSSHTVDISDLPQGVYYVKIIQDNHKILKKITVL